MDAAKIRIQMIIIFYSVSSEISNCTVEKRNAKKYGAPELLKFDKNYSAN